MSVVGLLGNLASSLVFGLHPNFRGVAFARLLLALSVADAVYLLSNSLVAARYFL